MKKIGLVLNGLWILSLVACGQQNNIDKTIVADLPSAFPGAEGFGKYTTGGREGKVFIVSNLDDKGPGSFREAVEAKERRIIVFSISGTIHLETKLNIRGDVTIAGQTAPGDGICLADNPVILNGDNIIVRYLRFRMGDKYQKGGMVDGNGGDDSFGGVRRKNIIIDHCSMSWSTDEVFSVYAGDSTTLQWNLISEPLNYSYHFETGDKDYEHHGYGGIWGGMHMSAHHNLFAHCNNRTPRFNGTRHTPTEFVDYRNNVIYNWGSNNIYAGEGGNYNIVNNFFKYGPNTSNSVKYRICNPGRNETIGFGKWFVSGNFVDEAKDVTGDNRLGVHIGNGGYTADKDSVLVNTAFQAIELMTTEPAEKAFQNVITNVGASLRRDLHDARIIQEVLDRTGHFIDVQGHYPHGTEYELTVNAWPELMTLLSGMDTDKDGMPDYWEEKNKLDPSNPNDAAKFTLSKSYTNIEVYINELVK